MQDFFDAIEEFKEELIKALTPICTPFINLIDRVLNWIANKRIG